MAVLPSPVSGRDDFAQSTHHTTKP
ncbi:hypothetical protein CCACVL1_08819 [Corchorus capsularis]|uniref:Uncharacterized protein n=1 Tax=Corchorus capsularis TaxID=210143 RepID=A0A1R3IYQ2_COCAP|nr:hypothetical protein CCACVL1_08819 [Corchorus capsularis]